MFGKKRKKVPFTGAGNIAEKVGKLHTQILDLKIYRSKILGLRPKGLFWTLPENPAFCLFIPLCLQQYHCYYYL